MATEIKGAATGAPAVRKEVIGDATLYLSDCRDLDGMVADACITDPVWPNCPPGLLAGQEDPVSLLSTSLSRITAKRLCIVLRSDSDPRFLSAVPNSWPFCRAQWLSYAVPMYVGRALGGSEVAYSFGEYIPSRPGQKVIPGEAPKGQPADRPNVGHPCSRNIQHMKFLVRWWSEEGEVVIDPFMGSGTTGVACAALGRKFIGIEIEERYFKIACERIDQARKQQRLFA